ncbi:hypothetical protein GCM10009535_00200 [Streptomyces thermocarboxydovorans]|uniref:Secreted protein n=1 Tax=Streptomyces thermocarboxydovorans TaxID=59298 RepID=A0ABN1H4S7_9ACTN
MSQAVVALGLAAVTASGCVWYVPALADLRARADRPVSRRAAAAACLSGWSTAGIVAVLLLVAEAWWIPSAAAVAGAALTAALRVGAAVQRRREMREAARHWAELSRQVPRPGARPSRTVVAVLLGAGLAAGSATAILRVAAGPGNGTDWLAAAAVPAAVVGLFLTLAIAHTRTAGRGAADDTRRPR